MDYTKTEAPVLRNLLTLTPAGVIVAGVLMPLFASAAVGLRFYSRRWQRLGLEADDWTVLAGTMLAGVLGLILIVGSAIGALGLHSAPPNPNNNPNGAVISRGDADNKAEKILMAYSIVEKPCFTLIKISIVLLYRRIFRGELWRTLSTVAIVVLSLMGIAFTITSALQCSWRNWLIQYAGLWATENHCVSAMISTLGFSIADVATDLAILVIPVPFVARLKMSTRRRIALFCVFVLASSSVAVGIIRLAVIATLTYHDSGGYRDLLGVMSTVPTVSLIQACIAIVASCSPTVRQLVTSKLSHFSSSSVTAFNKGNNGYTPRAGSKKVKEIFTGSTNSDQTKRTSLELQTLVQPEEP